MNSTKTSWGDVAEWYDLLVANERSYQKTVILPNFLRLLAPKKGMTVLDLGCGQGFFAKEFTKHGAHVIGVDSAPELIDIAKKKASGVAFHVASADAVPFVKNASIDAVTIILALQNIENVDGVFAECARVLKSKGRLLAVLNHPAFRIPKHSEWRFEKGVKQYRAIDEYLSESRAKIQMHPGDDPQLTTMTFHRPLQWYAKLLAKHRFAITRLEEWISHKKSQKGPRAAAEDKARKEIPLFLFLQASLYYAV